MGDVASVPIKSIEGPKTVVEGPSRLFLRDEESESDISGYLSHTEHYGYLLLKMIQVVSASKHVWSAKVSVKEKVSTSSTLELL